MLKIQIKRGSSTIEYDDYTLDMKTPFLKKMYVGDLIEYLKQKKHDTKKHH